MLRLSFKRGVHRNPMLKLCDNCATVYNVMFNSKKTVCIKFGNEVIFKKSMFIGYVNKLRSNFRHLQPHVLINLFKAYCCSFYVSQI